MSVVHPLTYCPARRRRAKYLPAVALLLLTAAGVAATAVLAADMWRRGQALANLQSSTCGTCNQTRARAAGPDPLPELPRLVIVAGFSLVAGIGCVRSFNGARYG